MALPPLSRRPEDAWLGGFLVVPPRPVRAVSVGAGLVVAGGETLHMMRPGAQGLMSCNSPPDIRPAVAVAAEPWAPRRFAIASSGRLRVFEGPVPGDPSLELTFSDPRDDVTHLAWTRSGQLSVLYFRSRNGKIGRLRIDQEKHEFLDAPPMAAIAADEMGGLAMIDIVGDEEVLVEKREGGYECRPLTTIPVDSDDHDDNMHVYLAISGAAVAYSVGQCWGTYVSWESEGDFRHCENLYGGPVAFHGGKAVFGAYCVENNASIFRQTRDGSTSRIAEIVTEWVPDDRLWPAITALAWDSSRHTLWGASPQLGLLTCKEPTPKGARVVLS